MIRPILATPNPYEAAKVFEKAGWEIDFMDSTESVDPLSGVSLYNNRLLLGTMDEKYVPKDAIPYIGTGLEIYITVPSDKLVSIHKNYLHLNPTELARQPWGDIAFEVKILGYKFMIAAEK